MSCEAKPHAQEHAWPSGPSLLSLLQPAARSRERENSIHGWLRVATDRYDNVADCTCICECSFRSGGSEYRSSEHRNSESKSKKKKSGITGRIIGDYCREVLLNLCHLDSSDRKIESCKLVDHCKTEHNFSFRKHQISRLFFAYYTSPTCYHQPQKKLFMFGLHAVNTFKLLTIKSRFKSYKLC